MLERKRGELGMCAAHRFLFGCFGRATAILRETSDAVVFVKRCDRHHQLSKVMKEPGDKGAFGVVHWYAQHELIGHDSGSEGMGVEARGGPRPRSAYVFPEAADR